MNGNSTQVNCKRRDERWLKTFKCRNNALHSLLLVNLAVGGGVGGTSLAVVVISRPVGVLVIVRTIAAQKSKNKDL